MDRICAFVLLLVASPAFVHAEVVVQNFDEPRVDIYRKQLEAERSLARQDSPVHKSNEPSDGTWFIPLFKVDAKATGFGSSTFFSLRNEGEVVTNVLVEYFDRKFTPPRQHAQRYALIPKQVAAVNVRDALADLDVGADGFARGLIRIIPRAEEPISVDVFQVDAENDFASGSPAFVAPDDFCTFWQVRFLKFTGASGGSVLTVLVNGPRGPAANNPPTLVADVYNQQGAFIRSAEIRTDQWAFEVDLLALAGGGASFGSVELILNAASLPGGVVSVTHGALGKFSVGLEGVCRDRI